jgi:hypothetical protein
VPGITVAGAIEPLARSRRKLGGMGGHFGAPHQNRKYRWVMGKVRAGSHVSSSPSALTW